MPVRHANAEWQGNLQEGKGTVALGSGAFTGDYSFASRFQEAQASNPEELIAAAHAGCYSMALANMLSEAGFVPDSIDTEAKVYLSMDGGPHISKIALHTKGKVPNISAEEFAKFANEAKTGCPISKALAAVEEIVLDAELVS